MLEKILGFMFSKKAEAFTSTQLSEHTKIGKNLIEKVLEIGSTDKPELFMFTAEQDAEGTWEKRWWLSDYSMLIFEEHQKIPQNIIDKVNAIEVTPEKPAKEPKKDIELISKSAKTYQLIEKDALPVIHGALDFTNDMGFIASPMSVQVSDENSSYPTVKDTVITSDRKLIILDWETVKKGIDDRLRFGAVPKNLRERWSRDSIYSFLHSRNTSYTPKEVFDAIKSKINFYMELLDDREYDLVAVWCIMTYLFPLFTSLPMLFINAIRGSGKSKLISLLGCICFSNTGKPTISISTPAFYRTIEESRSTILIDENERLKDKQKAELRELINACYKKGSVVKRTEERLKIGNIKGFFNVDFDVFAPVAMASIHSIDDVVESRCIRIGLQRTSDKIKGNRMVITDSPEWQVIRDMLYTYVIENFQDMAERYKQMHKFFISTSTADMYDSPLPIPNSEELKSLIYSRDLELWLPILTIGSMVDDDTFKRLTALAIDKTHVRLTEDITEETNNLVVESLVRTVDIPNWYSISSLIQNLREYSPEMGDWLNARVYSSILRTLGLYTADNKKRIKNGMVVFLKPEIIQALAKKMGLDIDEIVKLKDQYDLEFLKEKKMSMKEKFMEAVNSFGEKEIPIAELIEKVKQTGLSEWKAQEVLGKLCDEGILLKPREGIIKKIAGLLSDYAKPKEEVIEDEEGE